MATRQTKVIVNPAAGASSTYRKWRRIRRLLKHIGLSFDYEYTEGIGHAIELAKAAASDGYRYLIAVGGDGTVNEVANGILDSANSATTSLGIISTGTGSDFARSMGLSRHYALACPSLTSSHREVIDIGIVEYSRNKQRVQRFFVNVAGVGFDAATVAATERFPKYLGGTIPYLAGLLRTMLSYQNKPVTIQVDDRTDSSRVLSVVVANGRYLGGGMHVAPDASFHDNLLDVVTIGDVSKFDLIKSLPMIYKGTHGKHPKVSIEKAGKVTVASSEQILVHADGELLGKGPASFWLMPAALSIVK